MDIKNFIRDNNVNIVCMAVCFAAGFILGALLAPHNNKIEFHLFSGNGSYNKGNSAKSVKGRKKHKKA